MEPSSPTDQLTHASDQSERAQLGFDNTLRQRIAERMMHIVDIRPDVGADVLIEDPVSPSTSEQFQSKRTHSLVEKMKSHLDHIKDNAISITEQEVWEGLLKLALGKSNYTYMPDPDVAVIASKFSGIKIPDEDLSIYLAGNRDCAGIAVWDGETDRYVPVSRDESEIAQEFIDEGKAAFVVTNLGNFKSLSGAIADTLATDGYVRTLARSIDSFEDPDYNKIAHKLEDMNDRMTLGDCLSKFKHLDNAIADVFIELGVNSIGKVAANLSSFENPEYQKIANECIKHGEHTTANLAENLEDFKNLDNATAEVLLRDHADDVINSRDSFSDLPAEQIVDRLMARRDIDPIANYLHTFSQEERKYIGEQFMAGRDSHMNTVLADNLELFPDIDDSALEKQLLDFKMPSTLLNNIQKFKAPDINTIVNLAIELHAQMIVVGNLDQLQGLGPGIAEKLLNADKKYAINLARHAVVFQNPGEVLSLLSPLALVDPDLADAIIENIGHNFVNSPDELTDILKDCAHNYSTAQKIKQMDLLGLGVSEPDANKLLAFIATVKPELKDVKKENPYEDISGSINIITLTKPGTKLHKLASEVSKMLREAANNVDSPYYSVDTLIQEKWATLTMYEDDALFGERGQNVTDNMFATYRRLVADYIVLEATKVQPNRDFSVEELMSYALKSELTSKWLGDALDRANRNFAAVLNVDVLYYDKLFAEWDAKRLGQKDFQEVFLGRDGVYAFIGRRAQLQARKRFLGLEGEDHELKMPTYLVYPRAFRDSLSESSKYAYLSQNIPNPQNAYYYDTGYTGTIPQDIMRVFGLSEADWDERIRLLSASKRDRTVIGLKGGKDERDQIVSTVEYNVKNEETAEGLYRDSDDTLQPYAEPTDPQERLSYALVQQALHRHYYTKELLSLQSDELRIAMTSQTLQGGELRVSADLNEEQKNELKALFDTDNIGQKLLAEAKQIKISDPNEPYPDEAVFEVPLSGTDGVIVKSVVTDKQQGPVDEFEALVLLEELGIDAPFPLGRLFTNGQHGFIVMQKLPGISGRAIKDYFEAEIPNPAEQSVLLQEADRMMWKIARTIRRDTGLDKPWRLKDFMIVFGKNDQGQTIIERMLPIDFERAKVYDPVKPHSIKLGQDLDSLLF